MITRQILQRHFGLYLLALAVSALARTYYVAPAPQGDERNDGSVQRPWASIENGVRGLQSGDSLLIRGGTYQPTARVVIKGRFDRYVTIAGYPGETPVLDFQKKDLPDPQTSRWIMWDPGFVIALEASYVRIENIKVINVFNGAGFMGLYTDHFHVERCSTFDTHSSGISIWMSDSVVIAGNDIRRACNGGFNECITIHNTTTFVVRDNHIYENVAGWGNGGEGIDSRGENRNGKICGNRLHDLARVGLYLDTWGGGTGGIEVFGNVVYRAFCGMYIGSEGGGTVDGVIVHHNLFYKNATGGFCFNSAGTNGPRKNVKLHHNTITSNRGASVLVQVNGVSQVDVRNNIFAYNTGGDGIALPGGYDPVANGFVADYNLMVRPSAFKGNHSMTGDPLFADTALADFHLRSGSPALDQADPDPKYNDPDGTRGDLGAFPYQSVNVLFRYGGNSSPTPLSYSRFDGELKSVLTYYQRRSCGMYVIQPNGAWFRARRGASYPAPGCYIIGHHRN